MISQPALIAMIFLLSAGCATTGNTANTGDTSKHTAENADPRTVDDSRVTLGLGQEAQLSDGSRLSYTSLIDDSRCPPDVQCVWAGDAEIELRWKPARGSAQNLRLHTSKQGGATSAKIGGRTLSLVSLERGIAPKATLSIIDAP